MKLQNPGTGKYISSVILICLMALGPVRLSQAFEVPNHSLVYEFAYNKLNLGELEILIERNNDFITTTAVSHLNPIAQLFQSGLTEETQFSIDGDTIRVENGTTLSHDSKTDKRSYVIDRQAGFIKFSSGEDIPIEQGDKFESTSFPLMLLTSDITALSGTHIREINTKRVRYYIYLPPEMEIINVGGVEYNTWKVTRHKRGDTRRTVTVWLDRRNNNIPVRIISQKRKSVSVLTLKSVS